MGLETGDYINDLDSSNPVPGDPRAQGDDHLRLIKKVLTQSFPDVDRAQRFSRAGALAATASIPLSADAKFFYVDCTSGDITLTLPNLGVGNDGWYCWFHRVDASANDILIEPISGTINGQASIPLLRQYYSLLIFWSGTEYHAVPFDNDATKIIYDPTESGLESTNVQDALDEIEAGLLAAVAAINTAKQDWLSTPQSVTGSTYNFALGDEKKMTAFNSSSGQTATILPNSSVAFPIGANIPCFQKGVGVLSIAPGSGVTLNSEDNKRKALKRYSPLFLYQETTDNWYLFGSLGT